MHDTEAPTMSQAEQDAASDALASAAAEVDALRAEVARQTGIAVDYCARADAAEQMVVELRGLLQSAHQAVVHEAGIDDDAQQLSDRIDAALSLTEAVAGRWVSVEEHDEARLALAEISELVGPGGDDTPFGRVESIMSCLTAERDEAVEERDAAIAARDEAVAAFERSGAKGLVAMAQRDAAERARDEVGIQLAAAQAEIARMRPVVEAARRLLWSWDEGSTATERSRQHEDIRRALHTLDTVPGDTLVRP